MKSFLPTLKTGATVGLALAFPVGHVLEDAKRDDVKPNEDALQPASQTLAGDHSPEPGYDPSPKVDVTVGVSGTMAFYMPEYCYKPRASFGDTESQDLVGFVREITSSGNQNCADSNSLARLMALQEWRLPPV